MIVQDINELDDGMERSDPHQMVFVRIDMAPSLIDMRPGATTGWRRCHKPDPLVTATRKLSTLITLRITITGPWGMTDRTEVSQCQILSHTPDERVAYTHLTTKRERRGLASSGVMVPTARPAGGYSGASTTVMPRKY